jgi:hypothetical protein
MTSPSTRQPEPAQAHRRDTSLSPAARAQFTQAQAYEDAIAYRQARLAAPCPDCGPARCDDHATDLDLITSYQQAHHRTLTAPRGWAAMGTEPGGRQEGR